MRRVVVSLALALALSLVPAAAALAGGGGQGVSLCRAFGDGATLALHDSCFDGVVHTVEAGTTVTVENVGALPHTITAVDGSFDSGSIAPGASYQLTVEDAGPVRIYCTLHGTPDGDGMAGVLDVAAAEPMTPAAAETAGTSDLGWLLAAVAVGAAGFATGRRSVRTRRSPAA